MYCRSTYVHNLQQHNVIYCCSTCVLIRMQKAHLLSTQCQATHTCSTYALVNHGGYIFSIPSRSVVYYLVLLTRYGSSNNIGYTGSWVRTRRNIDCCSNTGGLRVVFYWTGCKGIYFPVLCFVWNKFKDRFLLRAVNAHAHRSPLSSPSASSWAKSINTSAWGRHLLILYWSFSHMSPDSSDHALPQTSTIDRPSATVSRRTHQLRAVTHVNRHT